VCLPVSVARTVSPCVLRPVCVLRPRVYSCISHNHGISPITLSQGRAGVSASDKSEWVYHIVLPSWTIACAHTSKTKPPQTKTKPVHSNAEPPFLTSPDSADDGG
jgi:hypothetical protein